MHFSDGNIYHIYNRGNQQQPVFFNNDNYIFFLQKLRKYLLPNADILCWCLMPNHFHLLVHANEQSMIPIKVGGNTMLALSRSIQLLLSSYTQALQKQNGFKGNLFQQKTKAKLMDAESGNAIAAFYYIHQNPWKAGLVKRIEDWEYSSFKDYAGFRKGSLCNKELGKTLLDIDEKRIYDETYKRVVAADKFE